MVSAGGKVFASDINEVIAGSIERPLCIVRRSTIQNIANNGAAMAWDTEEVDTHGWHSTSVNTSRITPLKAGWIRFSATVGWAVNATNRRGVAIDFNGGSRRFGNLILATATASQNVYAVGTWTISCNGSTDYVELFAYQNSGGALDTADTTSTRFEAEWIRDL